jgi:hypothetical protein
LAGDGNSFLGGLGARAMPHNAVHAQWGSEWGRGQVDTVAGGWNRNHCWPQDLLPSAPEPPVNPVIHRLPTTATLHMQPLGDAYDPKVPGLSFAFDYISPGHPSKSGQAVACCTRSDQAPTSTWDMPPPPAASVPCWFQLCYLGYPHMLFLSCSLCPPLAHTLAHLTPRHPGCRAVVAKILKDKCPTCDPRTVPNSGPAPVLARFEDFKVRGVGAAHGCWG